MAKGDIRFSVNATAAEYLAWLSKNTVLGKTANEVAAKLLLQRLAEMRQEEYKPPD